MERSVLGEGSSEAEYRTPYRLTDLHDVNRQARQWLAEVANVRLHHETRQRPVDRFRADALRPLPVIYMLTGDGMPLTEYRWLLANVLDKSFVD